MSARDWDSHDWVHCLPSPRFVWRAMAERVTFAQSLERGRAGYYAPMNLYRVGPFAGKVLRPNVRRRAHA